MGVVNVRQLNQETGDMVVLWSAFNNVMPVFCLTCSSTLQFMVTLEWLGTFDMVHAGILDLIN